MAPRRKKSRKFEENSQEIKFEEFSKDSGNGSGTIPEEISKNSGSGNGTFRAPVKNLKTRPEFPKDSGNGSGTIPEEISKNSGSGNGTFRAPVKNLKTRPEFPKDSGSGSGTVSEEISIPVKNLKFPVPVEIQAENMQIPIPVENLTRLTSEFFDQPCVTLAKSLLGKFLVRKFSGSGQILIGKIVETEAYLGGDDKASHSYQGRQTPRNKAMFMRPGTAYVYRTYGIYECFNISSQGEGSAVLLRALEPIRGAEKMRENRLASKASGGRSMKLKDLCNGPSKLCISMQIEKNLHDQVDMTISDEFFVAATPNGSSPIPVPDADQNGSIPIPDQNGSIPVQIPESEIVACARIGIESAGAEWAKKPLRFYLRNCEFVSRILRNV